MGDNEVGCKLPKNTYSALSEYAKSYGTTVSFMHRTLLEDAVASDRYQSVFKGRKKVVAATPVDQVVEELEQDFEASLAADIMASVADETPPPVKPTRPAVVISQSSTLTDSDDMDLSDLLGEAT